MPFLQRQSSHGSTECGGMRGMGRMDDVQGTVDGLHQCLRGRTQPRQVYTTHDMPPSPQTGGTVATVLRGILKGQALLVHSGGSDRNPPAVVGARAHDENPLTKHWMHLVSSSYAMNHYPPPVPAGAQDSQGHCTVSRHPQSHLATLCLSFSSKSFSHHTETDDVPSW